MAFKKCEYCDGETVITAENLNCMQDAILKNEENLQKHEQNKNNPHGVTPEQIGARPDIWMPTAEEVGALPVGWTPDLEALGAAPASHATDKNNPHGVTAAQVGARPDTWTPTASDVGARPNTWMPTASDVGARPDTWMPTPAEIGAALAGYGLGTGGVYPSSLGLTGCEIMRGGFYRWDTQPSDAPFGNAVMLVIPRAKDSSAVQIACGCAGTTKGVIAVRSYAPASGSSAWEYINPPMATGTEYRTTKRVNGAVVYTKRFSFGDLPNATSKRVQIPGFTSSYTTVDIRFIIKNKTAGHAMQLTYGADPGYFVEQTSSSVINLVVNTTGDFSTYSGTVTIEYTK